MFGVFCTIPMGKVTNSLLVCATPRSGSTLLCALLDGTGVAGHPQEFFERLSRSGLPRQPREYFEGVDDAALRRLLAPTDPGEPDHGDPIPAALAAGTTPNGVFSAKLMWTHLHDLADRLRRAPDAQLLAERFPDPHYVHVTRADKVAQAVSLWRAVQTRAWRAGEMTENGHVEYHAGAIRHLASDLTDHDDAWRAWFAAQGIRPLTVGYEALAADPRGTTATVLEHLGVEPAEIPDPPLRRQGDGRSTRWVERYRAEVPA
jgi:LPS sulfotransferase NodH